LANGETADPMHDFSLFVNDSDGSIEELEVVSKDLEVNTTSSIAALSEDELMCEACGKVIVACIRLSTNEPDILIFLTGEEKNCSKVKVIANDFVIMIAGDELKINKEKFKAILKGVGRNVSAHKVSREVLENVRRGEMVIAARIHEMI
jgi:hypothetical protein